jgi:hypothetical protein
VITGATVLLQRTHIALDGAPAIDRVATDVFTRTYHGRCMTCGFCNDWCCSHGVQVDAVNAARIEAHAAELGPWSRAPGGPFFEDAIVLDAESAGGSFRRTRVVDGACVFLLRNARGCGIHAWCLANGVPYQQLKPIVSALFPVTFDAGLLRPSYEVNTRELVCLGDGVSLYRGVRAEIGDYFGPDLVEELDRIEAQFFAAAP